MSEERKVSQGRGSREGSRGGRTGRGGGGRGPAPTTPKTPEEAVPVLKYGPFNNWIEFKKKLSIAALHKYGRLGGIIDEEEYDVPKPISFANYDSTTDPHGFIKSEIKETIKERMSIIRKMEQDRPNLYGFMLSKMSAESEDEFKRHKDYTTINEKKDPLDLWLALKELHLVTTISKNSAVILLQSKEDYTKLKMGEYETLTVFKERFDNKLVAYSSASGTTQSEQESAMDFLNKLCRTRYGQYFAYKINEINMDPTKVPKTVNEVYIQAKAFISLTPSKTPGGNATFATGDSMIGRRSGKRSPKDEKNGKHGNKSGDKTDKTDKNPKGNEKEAEPKTTDKQDPSTKTTKTGAKKDLSDIECYVCSEYGHYARDCPQKDQNLGGMTRKSGSKHLQWYEVALDSCSQVNVFNPRFLTNIRSGTGSYVGLSGAAKMTNLVGDLEGFFECQVCETCAASVLCMSDVEELYPITYDQGKSYTVHMEDKDVVFYNKNKIYVADFSEWITEGGISMMTVQERESMFSKKQVKAAKEAGEFVKNAGYPSEEAAIKLVRDGNVNNVPIQVNDIKTYFEIYGPPIESIRGKTTASKSVNVRDNFDLGLKLQVTLQDMTADVMYAGSQKFLVSLSSPLQLTITSFVKSLSKDELGGALQDHLNLLRAFGFDAKIVRVDPLKALAGLKGKFPGTEIDASGAGDHLPTIDIKIRRVKEMARSVIQGLDWPMPRVLVKYLITFCVSRINIRATSSTTSNQCARVKLTGRKVDYNKEFKLRFGDYAEVRDPKAKSNDVMVSRTEPCIALHPVININGSWKFFNLKTNKLVVRSISSKTPTTDLVVSIMTKMANKSFVISEHDFLDGEAPNEDEVTEEPTTQVHEPDPNAIENLNPEEEEEELIEEQDELDAKHDDPDEDPVDQIVRGEKPESLIPESVSGVRRSQRINAGTSKRYEDFDLVGLTRSSAPTRLTRGYGMALANLSVKVALEEFGKKAYDAILDELTQLFLKKKALKAIPWDVIHAKAKELSVIASHMFLREKYDANGKFEKIKARLVADGRSQNRADFENISAPTASLESIINAIKIVVEEDRFTLVLDVGGAYLNATIDREVYMKLCPRVSKILCDAVPELTSLKDMQGCIGVAIEKALYGLVQSAHLWYETLVGVLKREGFTANSLDACVWNKTEKGIQTTIVIYVDDLLITSKNKACVDHIRNLIEKEFLEIKTKVGSEITYLGMNLKRNHDSIEISMKGYIANVLSDWKDTDIREYVKPSDAGLFKQEDDALYDDPKKFHRTVAQLLYLCKRARPDIQLPVHYLCTRVKEPTVQDVKKLERVLGYLKGTIGRARIINKDGSIGKITSYIDAAFAAHPDGKGQSGGIIMMGSTVLEATTRKQKCASHDSTESELIALVELSIDVLWHHEWFEEQGYKMTTPLIYQDNTSTMTLVLQGGGKMRTSHMRAKQACVKERVEMKDFEIKYISTKEMVADVMTKPLDGTDFHKFAIVIMGSRISDRDSWLKKEGVRWINRASETSRARK